MTGDASRTLDRLRVSAQELMAAHPPRWENNNKRAVFGISSPRGCAHAGELDYSRWAAMPLPSHVEPGAAVPRLRHFPGYFDYTPVAASSVEWHVNFADPHLFGYYEGPLFAQDEMQVVEHPALGALREALVESRVKALTVERGEPTPVLVMGVERRCHVATDPSDEAGRPHGLYGNAFAMASEDAVRRATTRIDPPTSTNLTCMAAPRGGSGSYTKTEIEFVLVTVCTAFRAAVLESAGHAGAGARSATVVHTGWWGCGAFGGNRVLMAALQLVGAEMAGVDLLAFHSGWPADEGSLKEAAGLLVGGHDGAGQVTVTSLLEKLAGMRFAWGVGNGT